MSDSPRTDALRKQQGEDAARIGLSFRRSVQELTDHARTLERELAKAKGNVQVNHDMWQRAFDRAEEQIGRAESAEREAVELRESLRWIPVSERLPDGGVKVIAFYLNSLGHSRRVRAEYVPKFTLEEDGDFDGETEYDEATDTAYWPAGWYETNEHEDTNWRIDETVTHWIPLPDADALLSPETQEQPR